MSLEESRALFLSLTEDERQKALAYMEALIAARPSAPEPNSD